MALGTNVFHIALNLAASAHQAELIQQIKSQGGDVIQTSGGLCAKTSLSRAEFEKLIAEIAGEGLAIEAVTSSSETSPDVKAFLAQ